MSDGVEIRFSQVSHTFPGRPPRPALDGLSFTAAPGQFVALVGPSGCGKSTLLRLAAGLLTPSAGAVSVDGVAVGGTPVGAAPAGAPAGAAPAGALSPGQRVAWMAQSPALLPWRTARANVALAQAFLPPGAARMTPDEALARVGLAEAAGAYPFMLSGGMQQRVALARTLSLPAGAWLMDEPFSAVDELTRERLTAELMELWQPRRPTVLWVTHNLSEALRLADRVLVLSDRPARIAADLPVALPRPRDDAHPAFLALLKELRKALAHG